MWVTKRMVENAYFIKIVGHHGGQLIVFRWHNKLNFVNLQQLYVSTAGENENEGGSSSTASSLSLAEPVACAGSSAPLLCSDAILREGQQSEQLCVVCHYFPLSRALLPCRHTCICAICFCKLRLV
jgi:hypothetical protein